MIDEIMATAAAHAPGVLTVRALAGNFLFRPGDECHGFFARAVQFSGL
jgi:hypothetical protein